MGINRAIGFYNNHKKVVIVATVVIAILFIIFTRLSNFSTMSDRVWWLWDDCFYTNVANNISDGNGFNLSILEYHQVLTKLPSGEIVYKYELWDTVGRPYYFGGVIYPLFLAGLYKITAANAPNWLLVGSIANMILSIGVIAIVYLLAKRLFNNKVAIFSFIVATLLPSLYWYSIRSIPYVLACLFILLAVYFAHKAVRKRDWILVGIFAGLAHLTHTSGMLVLVSLMIWCFVRLKFKFAFVLFASYLLTMTPWLIRNQLMFGDISLGLGIPLTTILGWFGIKYGMYASNAITVATNADFHVFEMFSAVFREIGEIYRMAGIVAVILFLSAYGVYKFKDTKLIIFGFIYLIVTLLGYFYLAFATGSSSFESKHLTPVILILIPIAMYGFLIYLSTYAPKTIAWKKFWYIANVSSLVLLLVLSFVDFSAYMNKKYNIPMTLNSHELEFHEWIRENNFPKDTLVMSNAPHVLYLSTGLTGTYIYTQGINYAVANEVLDKYGIDYVAIYAYERHEEKDLLKLDMVESELDVTKIYDNGDVKFYEVNK